MSKEKKENPNVANLNPVQKMRIWEYQCERENHNLNFNNSFSATSKNTILYTDKPTNLNPQALISKIRDSSMKSSQRAKFVLSQKYWALPSDDVLDKPPLDDEVLNPHPTNTNYGKQFNNPLGMKYGRMNLGYEKNLAKTNCKETVQASNFYMMTGKSPFVNREAERKKEG